jgi:hypothetical protein
LCAGRSYSSGQSSTSATATASAGKARMTAGGPRMALLPSPCGAVAERQGTRLTTAGLGRQGLQPKRPSAGPIPARSEREPCAPRRLSILSATTGFSNKKGNGQSAIL